MTADLLKYSLYVTNRSPMTSPDLATALRVARKARGLSIEAIAEQAGVSPRLVSEFERGRRPHVSLDTVLRLLKLVDVPITIGGSASPVTDDVARAERAARRRSTWVGEKTMLTGNAAPPAPASHAARLMAVAQASSLAVNLQTAYRKQTTRDGPVTKKSAITRDSL